MQLSEFATLAEAQAFELITDKKQVGSGQARGFFVSNGIWTTLRQIQGDITNPLFALADAVIVTASDASSFFGLDPTTAEGLGNLASAGIMVDAGIMTDAQKDGLLSLALKSTHPFANVTQKEFDDIREPLVWTPCIHSTDPLQVWSVSASPRTDKFKFISTASVAGANAQVRVWWSVDNLDGTASVLESTQHMIQGSEDSLVVSKSLRRDQFRLETSARILKFEYKGRNITDVSIKVEQ